MSIQSYFSHDSNARNSEKLINVRMALGAEGYGIYFMIIERLREETNYMSVKDYNMIAFDLRVDTSKVKRVVEDFGLFAFTENGECFYSESLLRRMKMKDESSKKKSEAGKKGAAARWGKQPENIINSNNNVAGVNKNYSNAMAMPKENIARKEKESKEKISKDIVAASAADNSNKNLFAADSIEIRLSKYLYNKVLANKPNLKEPDYNKWAKHIDLLIRADKESPSTIRDVIDYAASDSFWKSTVLSTRKLRDKFPTLEIQMRESKKKNTGYYKPKSNKTDYNSEDLAYLQEYKENKKNTAEYESIVRIVEERGKKIEE